MKKQKDLIGLHFAKPLVDGIDKTVNNIILKKKEMDLKKKMIMDLFKMIVLSSKLNKKEMKQVSDAIKLLMKKGI